jgi:hypothetical protein
LVQIDGHQPITFYYAYPNNPHLVSHLDFNAEIWTVYYYEERPFLLEQSTGEDSYALLTDSDGSIRRIIDKTGNIIESRSYSPFGKSNIAQSWTHQLPIGFMGHLEDREFEVAFIYDTENQWTSPLDVNTGRFQSTSPSALGKFDLMKPEMIADIFRFEHSKRAFIPACKLKVEIPKALF